MPRAAVVTILLGLLSASAWAQVGLSPDELKLFNLVNQEREKAKLPKFQWDYHLAEAARAHSQELVRHRELSHQFAGEPTLSIRLGTTGVRFDLAAENVAEAPDVDALHDGLMHSPPHRANILDPKSNALGLAILENDGQLYVTEDFAHVLPTYSESEFRNAVINAFNQQRQALKLAPVEAHPDDKLREAACSQNSNAQQILDGLPGAIQLSLFTAPLPAQLPGSMKSAAGNRQIRRMSIGVCFNPGEKRGYGNFSVIAAFYP